MKQFADESEVALATLYSWFAGKKLPILAVIAGWIDEIVAKIKSESLDADSPADRMEATLLRTIDFALERPNLLRSCTRAFPSPDSMGIGLVGWIEFSFGQLLLDRMGDDIDFNRRLDVTRVVGGVWFAGAHGMDVQGVGRGTRPRDVAECGGCRFGSSGRLEPGSAQRVRSRIRTSWATVATCTPDGANTSPTANPRALARPWDRRS